MRACVCGCVGGEFQVVLDINTLAFPPPITGTRRSSSRNGTENSHEVSPNMYTHVVGTVLSVCNGEDTVWSLFGLVGSGNGGKRKGMNGRGSMDVRVTRPPPTPNTVSLHPTNEFKSPHYERTESRLFYGLNCAL